MAVNNNNDQEGLKWRSMLVLSLLLHGALFSALFWVPWSSSGGFKMNENVYEVSLVDSSKIDLPEGKTLTPKNATSAASKDNRQAKRISPSASQKNTVTIQKRNAKRIRPKSKTDQASSSQLLDNAISKIENRVKTDKDSDYLGKAIAAIDKKVDSSGGGKAGSGALAGSLAINMYKMKVETLIKSNWTYPGEQDIEAVVLIKIRKDGTVLETSFIKRSGDKVFDESVQTAIEKTKSLPPLPEGYKENYEEIKINFNLKDLE